MEGVLFGLCERENFGTWPSYAVFGGQFIPRVTRVSPTPCVTHHRASFMSLRTLLLRQGTADVPS